MAYLGKQIRRIQVIPLTHSLEASPTPDKGANNSLPSSLQHSKPPVPAQPSSKSKAPCKTPSPLTPNMGSAWPFKFPSL